ncbi:hypothetical protein M5K25_000047 [Dendrobium thyrsiflorum]|uniref:CCHC-type domain-containing protein n=1 Tax=Dendrobium thyrsiflorum TaxID=117978 RepID=A0ABD0VUH8_DENTH
MEDIPSYCFHCKSLGHSKSECHILHPHLLNAHTNVDVVPTDTETVKNGNISPLFVNYGDVVSNDILPSGEEGLVQPPSVGVLEPPEQAVKGNDVSLTVALPLASSCDKIVDDHSTAIIEDGVEVGAPNNCLLNLVVCPSDIPDPNANVIEGESAFSDDSGGCDYGSPASGDELGISANVVGGPLVDVPLSVVSNVGMLAHLARANPAEHFAELESVKDNDEAAYGSQSTGLQSH